MRYKKKKWQIVSAALAAMIAMQLCIPSATFAAVPTKKLKVITGFTELPEEVAHIQIPADAGENFEDYLNFPETIEASVVEYKNVDHQKNNADRDKGAEDEKAAADDSDKKEDSEIAAGSNAKKENLNEEETPETENSENMPDSNDEEENPETENSENVRKTCRKNSRAGIGSLPPTMPGIFSRMMSLKMRKSQRISRY